MPRYLALVPGFEPGAERLTAVPPHLGQLTRIKMVDRRVIETRPLRCKLSVLPLSLAARIVGCDIAAQHQRESNSSVSGFEPPLSRNLSPSENDGALRLIRTGLLPSSAACNHQIC